jgi:Family of unknown function (DUF7009)
MKLRIRRNSLRLRLTQSDVARLIRDGAVEESTLLGGAIPFTYRLLLDAQGADLRTGRIANGILVRIPAGLASMWSTSDQIGISAVERHPGGRETTVVIEKDFACLRPREGEEDKDAFPNPKMLTCL